MNQQFGNKDFVLNAVLYLADNEGWMELRNRSLKLRLLNKKITNDEQIFWQSTNLLIPIVLLLIFGFVYQILRKKKYTKLVIAKKLEVHSKSNKSNKRIF